LLIYLNDNRYWVSFLGEKRPERGVDHPLPFNTGPLKNKAIVPTPHLGLHGLL
jgi:hypothetical protein